MLIDTHIHTSGYSSCSILDPIDMVNQAVALGLSGISIMEHYHQWPREEIEELKSVAHSDLLIFSGQEIISSMGHLLIYGYDGTLSENLSVEEVVSEVHQQEGVVILAHPFRDGKNLGRSPEDLKDIFCRVDGMEVYNGNQNLYENEYALMVWKALGIVGLGASDAHSQEMVGKYVTWFQNDVRDEKGLSAEIKAGRCKPLAFK